MPKLKKNLAIVVVIMSLIAVSGWAAYYLKRPTGQESDTPPVLNLTGSKGAAFQGALIVKGSGFESAKSIDERYTNVDLSRFNQQYKGSSHVAEKLSYYYSPEELSAKEILGLLAKGNGGDGQTKKVVNEYLIAYYDSDDEVYRVGPAPSDDLQKALFEEARLEGWDDDRKIRKMQPFVIVMSNPQSVPEPIFLTNAPLEETLKADELQSFSDVESIIGDNKIEPNDEGWYLVPVPKNIAVKTFLAPIKKYVSGYYPQTGPSSFGERVDLSLDYPKTDWNLIWFKIEAKRIDINDDSDDNAPPSLRAEFCKERTCVNPSREGEFEILCGFESCSGNDLTLDIKDLTDLEYKKDFEKVIREKIVQGDLDPMPEEVWNMLEDPIDVAKFGDFATDPVRDGLDKGTKDILRQEFKSELGNDFAENLGTEIMTNSFVAIFEDKMTTLKTDIATFETENGVEVSDEEMGMAVATLFQETLETMGSTNLFTDSALEGALDSNVSLKSEFGVALQSTLNTAAQQDAAAQGAKPY